MTTQSSLDQLAARIEKAYRRRHPNWLATGLTPGVWTAAAVRLSDGVGEHRSLPIDPELFVAVQDYETFRRDPWRELTQVGATKAYRVAVRKVIAQLKAELTAELRWSRRFLDSGGSIDEILTTSNSKISPIAKLLLSRREGREDLAELVRSAAEVQHLACPLYQFACKNLIPGSAYPDPITELVSARGVVDQEQSFAWN